MSRSTHPEGMTLPHAVDAAVQKLLPTLFSDRPLVLALQSPASRDLVVAQVPAAKPEWTPVSEWLRKQPVQHAPVVPLYLGKSHGAEMRVGKAIKPAALNALPGVAEQARYLCWRTSLLARQQQRRPVKTQTNRALNISRQNKTKPPEPLGPPVSADAIERELAVLNPAARLASSGDLEVWLASALEVPNTLVEIGRLREVAFRAAGEGTGRAYDLDRFDYTYSHLFVWNRAAREIAGAYRFHATDSGPASLYTATLFHYGPEFLNRLGPAIELGRAFIRPEYQRSFAPLLLLWKAIGRFVSRNPRCRTLFGPVSISNQYQSISRELMIQFLEKRELLTDLAALVRPRNAPPRRDSVSAEFCRDLDELSDVVADLEQGNQGVPVLLRHYLRLGGKLLSFNIDRSFANALDGLIVVDLVKTDPRLLERYLGKAESADLLAYHQPKGNHGTLQDA